MPNSTAGPGIRPLLAVLAVLALLLLVGCSPDDADDADAGEDDTSDADDTDDDGDDGDDGDDEPGEPGGGGTVVYRLEGDWTDLDIQRTSISAQNRISRLVYEGMLAWGPGPGGDQEIVGHLAESWEVTPTSVEFTLREGPTCADGTPVTPSLVQRSWERMLEVSTTLQLAFGGTQGSSEEPATGAGPFTVSSDDAAGTVKFESTNPNGDLIYGFLGPYGGLPGGPARIVCPEGLDNPERLETELFGTGPYVMTDIIPGEQVVLELREDYDWGPNGYTAWSPPGMPDRVELRVVENDTTAANLFLEGELDVGRNLPAADEERVAASGDFQVVPEISPMTTDYLIFNARADVLDDIHLREALIMVIDPVAYDAAVHGGPSGAVINPTFAVQGVPCHDPDAAGLVPTGTPEEARQLLLDNGYTEQNGELFRPNGERLTVGFLGSPGATGQGGEYVADLWGQIGVDVDLENVERAVWGGRIFSGEYEVAVPSFGFDYPSPGASIGWISGSYPPDGNNLGVARNEEYENAIQAARELPPGEEACEQWITAARMLLENRWALPISARVRNWYVREGIDFEVWTDEPEMITFRVAEPLR